MGTNSLKRAVNRKESVTMTRAQKCRLGMINGLYFIFTFQVEVWRFWPIGCQTDRELESKVCPPLRSKAIY